MAPALEVVIIKARESYLKDPSTLNPMLEIIKASKGALGIYHGVAPEEPDTLMLFIVWDTIEDHQALIDDKERYAVLGAEFAKCADLSTINMFHVYLPSDLAAVLNAPYLSFGYIGTLKAGRTAEEALALLTALTTRLELPATCRVGGFAKAVEKNSFIHINGWDDPKFFYAARDQPEAKTVVPQLLELTEEGKRGCVKLIPFKRYQS